MSQERKKSAETAGLLDYVSLIAALLGALAGWRVSGAPGALFGFFMGGALGRNVLFLVAAVFAVTLLLFYHDAGFETVIAALAGE